MEQKLQYGQFPIYDQTLNVFLTEQPPMNVQCGKLSYLTGNFKLPMKGNLLSLCHSGEYPEKIIVDEITYKDPFGNVVKMDKHIEFIIHEAMEDYNWGFSTKINNLRWGCNIKYNARTGEIEITKDFESPILGIYVRLG